MGTLKDAVRDAVGWYYGEKGEGLNCRMYRLLDDETGTYSIIANEPAVQRHTSEVVVFARIEGDFVVIEEDNTDKPLLDKLLARGIPREKIILAYADEKIPEPV